MSRLLFVSLCVVAVSVLAADAPKPRPEQQLSRASACKLRFQAFCELMHRCSTGAEDLGGPGCEAIDPGCDQLKGPARFGRAEVEACVAGLKKLTCKEKVDPNEAASLEDRVPACRTISESEAP